MKELLDKIVELAVANGKLLQSADTLKVINASTQANLEKLMKASEELANENKGLRLELDHFKDENTEFERVYRNARTEAQERGVLIERMRAWIESARVAMFHSEQIENFVE